jgi:hypothetical protein
MYQSLINKTIGGIYNPKNLNEKQAKKKFVNHISNMRQYSNFSRKGKPIGKREATEIYELEQQFTDRLNLNRIKSYDRYRKLVRPKKKLPESLQKWRDFLSLEPWIKEYESYKQFLIRNGKRRSEFEYFKSSPIEYLGLLQPSAEGNKLALISRLINKYNN